MDFTGGPGVAEVELGELEGAMNDYSLLLFLFRFGWQGLEMNTDCKPVSVPSLNTSISISTVTTSPSCDHSNGFASVVLSLRSAETTTGESDMFAASNRMLPLLGPSPPMSCGNGEGGPEYRLCVTARVRSSPDDLIVRTVLVVSRQATPIRLARNLIDTTAKLEPSRPMTQSFNVRVESPRSRNRLDDTTWTIHTRRWSRRVDKEHKEATEKINSKNTIGVAVCATNELEMTWDPHNGQKNGETKAGNQCWETGQPRSVK